MPTFSLGCSLVQHQDPDPEEERNKLVVKQYEDWIICEDEHFKLGPPEFLSFWVKSNFETLTQP
jgi:hypothetical protein